MVEAKDTEKDIIQENEEQEDDDKDAHINNENLKCRLYRKDFPEEGDLVIVILTSNLLFLYRLR